MHSILQESEFLECPNCRNLIGSFSPICRKCGFMTGEQGIVELARIEKENMTADEDARKLFEFASISFSLLVLAYLLTFVETAFSVSFLFFSVVSIGIFWWKFVLWHRKHLGIEFPDIRFDSAKRSKNKAALFGAVISLLITILAYAKIL